jgi:hypothetical protein
VAADIGEAHPRNGPKLAIFNYIQEYTDGIMSESNTAVRPAAAAVAVHVERQRQPRAQQRAGQDVREPVHAVRRLSRGASPPCRRMRSRCACGRTWRMAARWRFAINGTFNQQDRQALIAARPVFDWLAAQEQYYSKQESAARVMLLGAPQRLGRRPSTTAYRGMFRLLTEEHIPFAAADNLDWLGRREAELVVATGWAPAELKPYLERGGKVLVVGPDAPDFFVGKIVQRWREVQGYMRVRDHGLFPSLRDTNVLMLNGDYTEVETPEEMPLLTLVPPSMFGPPEKIHVDQVDTDKAGVVFGRVGEGEYAWVPWDAATLYYLHSLPGHAGLLRDLADQLLGGRRQVRTNAHPMVEVSLMKQGGRHLLHLVNVSGHADTAYHAPIPMRDIRLDVAVPARKARATRSGRTLPVRTVEGRATLTLPELGDYELIVLE